MKLYRLFRCGKFLIVALLLGICCGCSKNTGPQKFQVSGKATFDGTPIHTGTITFEPDGTKGNTGPQAIATIENGEFHTLPDKGVVGGAHIVKIVGYDGKPVEEGGAITEARGTSLFPQYQTTIDFPMEDTEQTFNVPKK